MSNEKEGTTVKEAFGYPGDTEDFDSYFNEDAEQINNILPASVKPTVVIMNPPFSAAAELKALFMIVQIFEKHLQGEEAARVVEYLVARYGYPRNKPEA